MQITKYLLIFRESFKSICCLGNPFLKDLEEENAIPPNIARYFSLIESLPFVQNALKTLPSGANYQLTVSRPGRRRSVSPIVASKKVTEQNVNQEGKFIDLPGATMGEVVVRFPPEASG